MKRSVTLAVAAVLCAVAAAPAGAATTPPRWDCRASALYVPLGTTDRLEPLVANGVSQDPAGSFGAGQCTDDDAGVPRLDVGSIHAGAAYATTRIDPDTGLAVDQSVTSTAGLAQLQLRSSDGKTVLGVDALEATATAGCDGTTPVLSGTSRVVGLTLNGEPVDIPADGQTLDLDGLGSIAFNSEVREGDALVRRALDVKLLGLRAVVGEARASGDPGVCVRPEGRVCPDGSVLDVVRMLCVIPSGDGAGSGSTGSGGSGSGTLPAGAVAGVVVGSPAGAPSGGTVLTLADARAKYPKARCLAGRGGPAYAVVGTKGADRITGTNGRDRILALGGRDSIGGGRGSDCLEGGTGRDVLSGSLGNDRITGGRGNDALIGGSGTDRLFGGVGSDSFNAGYGGDRIVGGRGNDVINVATAGPPATIGCGAGRDKVRANRNEKRRLHRCERVYLIR